MFKNSQNRQTRVDNKKMFYTHIISHKDRLSWVHETRYPRCSLVALVGWRAGALSTVLDDVASAAQGLGNASKAECSHGVLGFLRTCLFQTFTHSLQLSFEPRKLERVLVKHFIELVCPLHTFGFVWWASLVHPGATSPDSGFARCGRSTCALQGRLPSWVNRFVPPAVVYKNT